MYKRPLIPHIFFFQIPNRNDALNNFLIQIITIYTQFSQVEMTPHSFGNWLLGCVCGLVHTSATSSTRKEPRIRTAYDADCASHLIWTRKRRQISPLPGVKKKMILSMSSLCPRHCSVMETFFCNVGTIFLDRIRLISRFKDLSYIQLQCTDSKTFMSRVLPEKLTTGPQLVQKFTEFYAVRRFITVLISARHLSLS
jgi:hypothetical protein